MSMILAQEMLTNPISGFSLDVPSLTCQSTFYSSLEVYRCELVYFVTTLDSFLSIATSSWNYDTTRNTTIAKFGKVVVCLSLSPPTPPR